MFQILASGNRFRSLRVGVDFQAGARLDDHDILRQANLRSGAVPVTILASLVQQRMWIGLGRGYLDDDGLLRGIRGRVDFRRSLDGLAFEHGMACCRYQTYDLDTPQNRVIRATMARLAQVGEFGTERSAAEEIRHRLRVLVCQSPRSLPASWGSRRSVVCRDSGWISTTKSCWRSAL